MVFSRKENKQMNATMEQWQDLYEAAAAFKRAECWDRLTNGHIFGVENPMNKEIGYCCVLGNGGEMYGLAVYLGTKGLETLVGMLSGELDNDPMFTQHCLMLSFDNRNELYPNELKQIKELGLKFRGAKAWPTFRLYEPGFLPWPVQTQEQVLFLTMALQQTVEVVKAYKENPDALLEGDDETFLTRVADEDNLNLIWSDQWLVSKPIVEVIEITADPINELRLAKAKKSLQRSAGVWEIDCFFAPMPIKEGVRPYYPMMCLIVDQETGQILRYGLSEKSGTANKIVEHLFSLIEQTQVVPKEIWVAQEEVFHYLRQILLAFEIQAYLTGELPALEEAREGMMDYFESGMR
jgi:hypothetical protein